VADIRKVVGDGRGALAIFGLGDQDGGGAVMHLCAKKLTAEGGVHRRADCAQLVDPQPDRHRIDIVVEDGGHGLTRLDAQLPQAVRDLRRRAVDLGVGVEIAAEVQEYPVGDRRNRPGEGSGDGVLRIDAGAAALLDHLLERAHRYLASSRM
jgi:hypothetical protein